MPGHTIQAFQEEKFWFIWHVEKDRFEHKESFLKKPFENGSFIRRLKERNIFHLKYSVFLVWKHSVCKPLTAFSKQCDIWNIIKRIPNLLRTNNCTNAPNILHMLVIFFPHMNIYLKLALKQKDKKHVGMEMKINRPILHENKSRGIIKCTHSCTQGRNQDPDKSTSNITGRVTGAYIMFQSLVFFKTSVKVVLKSKENLGKECMFGC